MGKTPFCYACSNRGINRTFPTWESLNEHIRLVHPEVRTGRWASKFETDSKQNYNRSRYKSYNSAPRGNYTTVNNSSPNIPPNLIAYARLKGRTEGEIQAFLNIASKVIGLTPDEIKRALEK